LLTRRIVELCTPTRSRADSSEFGGWPVPSTVTVLWSVSRSMRTRELVVSMLSVVIPTLSRRSRYSGYPLPGLVGFVLLGRPIWTWRGSPG
jgi:hypothetical protein